MKRVILRGVAAFSLVATMTTLPALMAAARAQGYKYVHPAAVPGPAEFPAPPADKGFSWKGPKVGAAPIKCWYAEPTAPDTPVGGDLGTQAVQLFIPLEPSVAGKATTPFRQSDLSRLAGGGKQSPVIDMPAGIFLSVKAHPVFRVTNVEYPVRQRYPELFGPWDHCYQSVL